MTTRKRPFLENLNAWTIWFQLVGKELARAPEGLTSEEIARISLNVRGLDAGNEELLADEDRTIARLLTDLSHWGLISGGRSTRPVPGAAEKAAAIAEIAARNGSSRIQPPRLIMNIPVQVAKLNDRGARLLKAAKWRQQTYFASRMIGELKIWGPLKTGLAVSGGLVTLLKMVLLWQSHHTAIVAGVGGAIAFALQLVGRRPT